MPFPEQLETARLQLRWPVEADAAEMFARYAQCPEVCRYMSWTPHRSLDDTVEHLRERIEQRQVGTSYGWLIYPRDGGPLAGSIGFGVDKHRAQFGYCLARDAWGRGYATEAARAIVELALSEPTIWRIEACCDLEHRASAHVLEKAGLLLEGVVRRHSVLPNLESEPRDMFLYARVRDDLQPSAVGEAM